MKPLTLSFENVRSYATFGPIDFTDRSLVGILGDTGAGKSTIIEALCLALYGQGSWQGATIRDLMADNAPHMRVDLTFQHDGNRWRVQRTFYANTRPTQALLRNLDTNAAFDNVRIVDQQIERLLRMRLDAFKSAVVLPQGRFTTLLHASAPDRAKLLRGIFGADMLAVVENLTNDRLEALGALLTKAKVERATLPLDPAADARDADDAYTQLKDHADALTRQTDGVRDLIAVARAAADAASTTRTQHAAVLSVSARVTDAELARRLEEARTADAQVRTERQKLDEAETAARAQIDAAEQALKAAADAGLGRSALDAADAVLAAAPGRAERLRTHAAELTDDQNAIDTAARDLADRVTAMPSREQQLNTDEGEAALAEKSAADAAEAAGQLREHIEDVITAAHQLRDIVLQHASAADELAGVDAELGPAQTAADTAVTAQADAEAKLAQLQREEAAATASAGLRPGDDCPVCARELPAHWHAPTDQSGEMEAARTQVEVARDKVAEADATARLLDGRRKTAAALVESTERTMRGRDAALQSALADLPSAPTFVALPGLNAATVTGRVREGVSACATADHAPSWVRTTAAEIAAPAAEIASTLRATATRLRKEVTTARADLAADQRAIRADEESILRRRTTLSANQDRWQSDLNELFLALRSLPMLAGAELPSLPATTVPDWIIEEGGPLAAAHEVITRASEGLAEQEGQLQKAREMSSGVTADRQRLATRAAEQVARPTRGACRAMEKALASLPERSVSGESVQLPQAPEDDTDPSEVAAYATRVAAALSTLGVKLSTMAAEADAHATATLTQAAIGWRALLSAIRHEEADDAKTIAANSDDGAGVMAADALTPVTDAIAVARAHASTAEERARIARGAIPRVAELDHAIGAGQLRADALAALRAALRPSKFPAHLVARRTTALLGLASELFGQLSGEEFGFSSDFQIVARRTGSVRDPKTLSGGETFQAALALALSLVELYSRSAGRLGALFLDEGFGSLDSEALAAALDALSAETGGDKLVAVISHLHAVAEAVTDVLWVSKQGSSQAHWLQPEEIDALVNADVAAGLLASG